MEHSANPSHNPRWKELPPFETPSAARSRNMAAMRSKDTAPELAVRRALHRAGFRFRLHRRDIPGRPDLVLPRYQHAVFVHGCFWHGHGCSKGRLPVTNADYWAAKVALNKSRDLRVLYQIGKASWKVTIIWQCELESGVRRLMCLLRREQQNLGTK